jgi:uncharacterized spore protein YtfJ
MSLGLSGRVSGTAKIRSSHSISAMVRSASIAQSSSTKRAQVKRKPNWYMTKGNSSIHSSLPHHPRMHRDMPEGVVEMSSLPILQSLKESILTANVKAVYGEPIAAQGKTVIPVAKIIYGFGAGAGTGGVGNSGTRGEGGGGGGGARAIPVGVVEVSDQQTRFVPITDRKKLTGAAVIGIGVGMWLSWRRRR